jgi:ATP-dependent DNA helicase RecG
LASLDDPCLLLSQLIALAKEEGSELEWLEFKDSHCHHDSIGQYFSALSNSAALARRTFGYLVFGVEDHTFALIGTKFNLRRERRGNEELELWLNKQLTPRVDVSVKRFPCENATFVIFQVQTICSGVIEQRCICCPLRPCPAIEKSPVIEIPRDAR